MEGSVVDVISESREQAYTSGTIEHRKRRGFGANGDTAFCGPYSAGCCLDECIGMRTYIEQIRPASDNA